MQEERRAHSRRAQEELVKVDVTPENSPNDKIVYDCFSRDFSANGVRIHGSSSFELGTAVNLVVHMSQLAKNFDLEGTIKWITETTEHEVVAGIEVSDSRSKDYQEWSSLFED